MPLKGTDISVYNLVNKAIRTGKLPRAYTLRCSHCGKVARDYHHEDYTRPLDVTPLCRKCHVAVHLAEKTELERQRSLLRKARG